MRQVVELSLIRRFQCGDTAAFEALIDAEGPRVLNFVRKYVREQDIADDIYQEAWLRIWHMREKLSQPLKYRSWLYRIVRHAIYDQLKAENWKVEIDFLANLEEFEHVADARPSPCDLAHLLEWRRLLRSELDKLDDTSQEVLALRYGAGLGFREIAEAMNIPQGTVCAKLYRGIDNIRCSMERKGLLREGGIWKE
jgi:RNA polymerase sigma-70 factor (ECF subfamily)